jgi:hypothetical protein
MVTNSFVGPPLGSLLIAVMFALPFIFDAGTFVISAVLLFTMSGKFMVERDQAELDEKVDWLGEIKEGVRWLWSNQLLRVMAIVLGLLNALTMMVFATFVLFAQEVLEVTPSSSPSSAHLLRLAGCCHHGSASASAAVRR